jgi:hypothetical protein
MKPKKKQKKLRIAEAGLSPAGFSSSSPRKLKQASFLSVRRRFIHGAPQIEEGL